MYMLIDTKQFLNILVTLDCFKGWRNLGPTVGLKTSVVSGDLELEEEKRDRNCIFLGF